MKTYLLILTLLLMTQMHSIINFSRNTDLTHWKIIDDVVMGGRSGGSFFINSDGHAVFKGTVSLENNGGFSSVRYRMKPLNVTSYKKIILKIKGDGNRYQLRVKADTQDYYSFISYFNTSGEWENIEIELAMMYPTFRGRKLKLPNFKGDSIEELGFLIGNKKPQEFQLLIDKISLK